MNKYYEDNYKILYLKYKSKYIKLKQLKSLNNNIMIGGDNSLSPLESQLYINSINSFISEIENTILKNTNTELINLTNKLSNYLIENDIPINLKFNAYNIEELKNSLKELKIQIQDINKIYDVRTKIYSMEETNMDEILDYIIKEFKINSILDIENLFTLQILGYNKNYIILYMVLLKWLIVNKIQLSVLDKYISILSYNNLKLCLASKINSDEYLPMILILINSYINSFPIKKVLLIKKPIEKIKNIVQIDNDTNYNLIKYDTKNKILQYESGQIKEAIKLNFDDLIIILYNLFKISVYKL